MFFQILRFSFIFIILVSSIQVNAQYKILRKVSFSLGSGACYLPGKENSNVYGIPQNNFGNYEWMPAFSIGAEYRINKNIAIGEFINVGSGFKKNHNMNLIFLATRGKYNILDYNKRFSPYVFGEVGALFININRDKNERFVNVPSTGQSNNLNVTEVIYKENDMNLVAPSIGAGLGAGFDLRINDKFTLFAQYEFNYLLGEKLPLLFKAYPNATNINMEAHTISAGVTMRIFKKTYHLLAAINKDTILTDYTITIEGNVNYKKEKFRSDKPLTIQIRDSSGKNVITSISADQTQYFVFKRLNVNSYQFTLDKYNRKIRNADIRILFDYKPKVRFNDDIVLLDEDEDVNKPRLLNREGNFTVQLREGTQHEIKLTPKLQHIYGQLNILDSNSVTSDFHIILKDKNKKIVDVVIPNEDGQFKFTNLGNSQYTVVIKRVNGTKDTKFNYSFLDPQPDVEYQDNGEKGNEKYEFRKQEPQNNGVTFQGKLLSESGNPISNTKARVLLINKEDKMAQVVRPAKDGSFRFDKLKDENYDIVYDIPNNKEGASLKYSVVNFDTKTQKEYIYKAPAVLATPKVAKTNIQAKGKVSLGRNITDNDKILVHVVDENKQIQKTIKPKENGNVTLENLPNKDYSLIVESQKIGNDQYKFDYLVKQPKPKVEDLIIDSNQYAARKTYDMFGNIKTPKGFGNQVGAYVKSAHLRELCESLVKLEIDSVYIQVVGLVFRGKSVKFYRVVVGDYENEEIPNAYADRLRKSGYEPIIRKHQ